MPDQGDTTLARRHAAAPLALGAPPGALPAPPEADRQVPEADAAALGALAEEAWSANTRRVYRRAWASFEGWCRREGRSALPAAVETVAIYVSRLAARGLGRSSLNHRVAAIAQRHALAGYDPPPTAARQVRHLLKAARRGSRQVERGKSPVTLVELGQLLAVVEEDTLRGWRDRALLLVGFWGAFRRSELVAIKVEHVREVPSGIAILVPWSKTDQEGEGAVVGLAQRGAFCPVTALATWLRAAKITSGPVFRPVYRSGKVGAHALGDRAVARVVKHAAWAAGLEVAPAKGEQGLFSGHSLRAGLVTQAYRDGVPEAQIMGTTRHKSATMLARYARDADPVARGASGKIKG